jgi:hypothetical protein
VAATWITAPALPAITVPGHAAPVEEADGVFAVIARHRNELIQDLMLLANRGASIPFS